ncbi:hypothetical protein QBC46DRAFT_307703 [Diplogelasinospora grovesii]|uniref:DUF6546 domain-containing protein n=1 Tax=Diplogelasinospora grovesii TaxID=303347 RepID=A0AAN6S837_9PEZI|nr:hypothetical protein QBC46DRAFT_307703 [Diplogelasinospora grovesii]
MSWHTLPAELRLMILELVSCAYTFRQEDRYARAGYASVCREWQCFFEVRIFRRLIVDQDRISDLDKFTAQLGRRRANIKQIQLRVKLADYDCSVCQLEEDPEARKQNNLTFTKAVVDLLTVLSKWPKRKEHPTMPVSERGVSLEISAFSPSDHKHGFRDFRLQDDYPIWFDSDQMKLERYHDPDHGWENGRQGPVSLGARKRITEKLTLWDGDGTGKAPPLPKVKFITVFTVRRQSYRSIEISSLKKLLRAFPNLHTFIHEPWYNVTPERQQLFESDYLQLVRALPRLNKNLRDVILFQDFCRTLNPDRPTDGRGWSLGAKSRRPLGRALAKTTRLAAMERFSAAYFIDAYDFFHGFDVFNPQQQPGDPQVWNSLQSLCLTSGRLNPHITSWKRQKLLARAGRAAALMPSLQSMILWNGGEGFSYIMDYRRFGPGGEPLLFLGSNISSAMRYDFSPEVISIWRLVPKRAREPPPGDLRVWVRRFLRPRTSIKTFATTVEVLMREDVVHYITAHQLIAEEKFFLPVTDGSQEERSPGEGET